MIAKVHRREQNPLAFAQPGDIFAHFGYLAGDITAEDMRQLDSGHSLADPDVKVVHGAGFHAHQDLIFSRLRVRNIFVAEDFRPAEFVNANSFHGSSFWLLAPSS